MSKRKTFDEQMASYERQLQQIKARKQDAMARHSKKVRKAEQSATFELGRMILDSFDGEWESVDFERLSNVISNSSGVISGCTVTDAREIGPDAAAERLKAYQQRKRSRTYKHEAACDEAEPVVVGAS